MLYALTQQQLAHTLFPLGELTKEQARSIALQQGFVSANRPDSQDICFIPDGDYAGFIRQHTGRDYPEGDFVDTQGNVLGRHKGLIHYTVGQRRGLGVSAATPLYVQQLDTENNRVVLCAAHQLFQKTAIAGDFNWIAMDTPSGPVRCRARARYHQPEQPATAYVEADGTVRVELVENDAAPISVRSVEVFHDEKEGALRGRNLIHIYSAGGMNVAHLGDLGHVLTEEQVAAIGAVDAVMIPVGGFYTIDAETAKTVCTQLKPRVIIPMHYRHAPFGLGAVAGVEPFLALWQAEEVHRISGNSVEIAPDTAGVWVPTFRRPK